jgi:hypothetical protein
VILRKYILFQITFLGADRQISVPTEHVPYLQVQLYYLSLYLYSIFEIYCATERTNTSLSAYGPMHGLEPLIWFEKCDPTYVAAAFIHLGAAGPDEIFKPQGTEDL